MPLILNPGTLFVIALFYSGIGALSSLWYWSRIQDPELSQIHLSANVVAFFFLWPMVIVGLLILGSLDGIYSFIKRVREIGG